jgi:hypothetical protein
VNESDAGMTSFNGLAVAECAQPDTMRGRAARTESRLRTEAAQVLISTGLRWPMR